ncbi:unnamed protein product [Effrenium voratum]|nr:unnamed protein product [Effrenium voratum]
MLSVAGPQVEMDTLPFLLVVFVVVVAALLGMVVAGLHDMVKYAGCPLGINGCNSFSGPYYEKKGYILQELFEGYIPEDVLYVLMATISMLCIGLIAHVAPDDVGKQVLGGGTVQSLLAVAAGIPISLRCALVRVIVTALYFVGGGTMGGDGPTIQICTALAGMIGWACGIRAARTQSLLASLGFCCGFASSFNAPLSGILFAMEELQHVSSRLTTRVICIILIGSIVSTAVMRSFLGNKVLFKVSLPPDLEDAVSGGSMNRIFGEHMWMLVSVGIGVLCALVGYCFSKLFVLIHYFLHKYAYAKCPRYLVFALLGGISAAIGSAVFRLTGLRGVWGIGVQSLQVAFNAETPVEAGHLVIFAIGKLLAFAIGVSARFPGDTLEPVLIAGSFLGGFVGKLLPEETAGSEANSICEIFGMVGLFASCFRFPLTPVVIVLELTGTRTYNIILPVALSSFTAMTLSNHLFEPILEQILHQDGIDLEAVAELAELAEDEEMILRQEEEGPAGAATPAESDKPSNAASAMSHDATTLTCQIFGSLEESMLDVSSHDRTRRASEHHGRLSPGRRASLASGWSGTSGLIGRGIRRLSMHSAAPSAQSPSNASSAARSERQRRLSEMSQERPRHRLSGRRNSGRRNSRRRSSERSNGLPYSSQASGASKGTKDSKHEVKLEVDALEVPKEREEDVIRV